MFQSNSNSSSLFLSFLDATVALCPTELFLLSYGYYSPSNGFTEYYPAEFFLGDWRVSKPKVVVRGR